MSQDDNIGNLDIFLKQGRLRIIGHKQIIELILVM